MCQNTQNLTRLGSLSIFEARGLQPLNLHPIPKSNGLCRVYKVSTTSSRVIMIDSHSIRAIKDHDLMDFVSSRPMSRRGADWWSRCMQDLDYWGRRMHSSTCFCPVPAPMSLNPLAIETVCDRGRGSQVPSSDDRQPVWTCAIEGCVLAIQPLPRWGTGRGGCPSLSQKQGEVSGMTPS